MIAIIEDFEKWSLFLTLNWKKRWKKFKKQINMFENIGLKRIIWVENKEEMMWLNVLLLYEFIVCSKCMTL